MSKPSSPSSFGMAGLLTMLGSAVLQTRSSLFTSSLLVRIYLVLIKRGCHVQVAQVLLTLPYSFAQLGMVSGILLQLFYGLMGSWTAYLITSLYLEYRTRKERHKTDFRNHVIQVSPHPSNKQSIKHHTHSLLNPFAWFWISNSGSRFSTGY